VVFVKVNNICLNCATAMTLFPFRNTGCLNVIGINFTICMLSFRLLLDLPCLDFLRGRQFGGLALLIKKYLFAITKLVGVDSKCRCLAVITTLHNGVKLLVTYVYFPCSVSGMEYESAVLDCIGFIDNVLLEHEYDKVILLGDFNFECKEQCSGYRILRNLLLECNLQCC